MLSSNCILSIIVPIYKVEPYLAKCINSLLNQDLAPDKYEIILIDDGSPDNCPSIADRYAKLHPMVTVVHKTNGGLSSARNCGIRTAMGKYIQFVDSDDYLEPNVLAGLLKKMEEEQLDVLRFNYQNVDEQYKIYEPNHYSQPFVDYRDEICSGSTFLTERLGYGCYATHFIIKHTLLGDCFFTEGIYFEDTEWTPRMLLKAQRVNSTDCMVYNYLIRHNSITTWQENSHQTKLLEDRFRLIDSLKGQLAGVADKRWYEGMIAQTVITILTSISPMANRSRRGYIHKLTEQCVFPLSIFHATKAARNKIYMANFSPALLCCFLNAKSKLTRLIPDRRKLS